MLMKTIGNRVGWMEKKIGFFLLFFLILINAKAQSLKHFTNHCGLYYRSTHDLNQQLTDQAKFYDWQPHQTIASVGAQCANWEAAFSVLADSLTFYLEDIDSSSLNESQARFAWNYYSALTGRPLNCQYKIVIGDEQKTNLPEQFFDKILVINSFHEFSHPAAMLADLGQKLKPGGTLYIDEPLAKKSGELHVGCHKRIYTNTELIFLLQENGFTYANGLELDYRKSTAQRKIFAFRKK
jgi:ubiquinone/menaquinone biosynthesis C-methylase UbiE